MSAKLGRTETGRIYPRSRTYQCESCKVRNAIGEPRASDTWPARLHLTEVQLDLLLVAAAEFRDLSIEAGEPVNAIAFLDWIRPDALSPVFASAASIPHRDRGAA